VRVQAEGVDVEWVAGDCDERPVILGIRPEHLRFATSEPEGPSLAGTVVAVENLGSEEIAFCDVGEHQVAVRGPRPLGVAVGERVTLTTDRSRCYLFDPTSTRRLDWVEDPGAGHVHVGRRALAPAPVVVA
jgi:multiple sugar transport system ATP-binding protein